MGNTLVMPVVIRWLSVGCPWVTPIGSTHGYDLITALRFGYLCGLMAQQDRSPGQSEATPPGSSMFVPITPCWGKRLIIHLFILVLPIQGAWGWGHHPRRCLGLWSVTPSGRFSLIKMYGVVF